MVDNDGFRAPDWNAALDVEAAVAACPDEATIKGLMSQALVDAAKLSGVALPSARPPYHPFQDYSLREHMRLLVESAQGRFPSEPVRVGLRRFGFGSRGVIEQTPYGRVAFGRTMTPLQQLVAMARSYKVVLGIDVAVVDSDEAARRADVAFKGVRHFLDSVHVGVVEGNMKPAGVRAEVTVRLDDLHNGVFRVRW